MAHHYFEPDDHTLHGYFSPDERAAIATIQSGDTVQYKTLDAGWGIERPRPDGGERKRHPQYEKQPMKGHCLVGPIAIEGAKAGMTLEIAIDDIITGDFGFTYGGGFAHLVHTHLGIDTGEQERLVWDLDTVANTATNQLGHTVTMSPFMGVMGMPPPDDGYHPTPPPRIWGGNIDCKELVTGTTLYLPIPVDGGLFSVGDGHAAQGDGEVSVQAIECPIERVNLTFTVREDMPLKAPRARINGAWVTFGFAGDLQTAALMAVEQMVELMMDRYDVNKKQAIALASPTVDLRVTQIANPTLGVHAILRDDAIR